MKLLGFSCLSFLLFSLAWHSGSAAPPPKLDLVGSVEGKTFWTSLEVDVMGWAQALDFCHGLNMTLGTIESSAQDNVVTRFISQQSKQYFWLYGSDLNSEGKYYWMTTGEPFEYTNWKWGNGESSGLEKNCLHLNAVPMGSLEGWVPVSCSLETGTRPLCQN